MKSARILRIIYSTLYNFNILQLFYNFTIFRAKIEEMLQIISIPLSTSSDVDDWE